VPVLDPEARSARARLAAKTRHHGAAADITAEQTELARSRTEHLVREIVNAAPPLTIEQRAQLAVLLLNPSPDTAA
jgi:hypothetical protein